MTVHQVDLRPVASSPLQRHIEVVIRGAVWGAAGGCAAASALMAVPWVFLILPMVYSGDIYLAGYCLGAPLVLGGGAGLVEGLAGGLGVSVAQSWIGPHRGRAQATAGLAALVPPLIVLGYVESFGGLCLLVIFTMAAVPFAVGLAPLVAWRRAERPGARAPSP